MALAREMALLSAAVVLLFLANSVCSQACNDTDVRLVGGRNELEGRVEVCFQGQWGTVCDDSWDIRDAIVVCRQLNLTSEYALAVTAAVNNNGIFVPGTGPIFLDNVGCGGNETNLADCPNRGVGVHDCRHREDAGVICSQVPVCNNTDIRLVGDRNNSESQLEGRVEVCYQGHWGTVCRDFWNLRDAVVTCRQLGATSEYAIAVTNNAIFGPGTGPIFLDNVGCSGNEAILADCPHNGVGVHSCRHNEDAGVICFQQICNDSDVRLVNGRNMYEGRVEVCQRGVWGTVCDDNWDTADALVVCRQLGLFTGDAIAITSVTIGTFLLSTDFGPGSGPIFLDNVRCRGNETNLDDCPHNGVGVHNCRHIEDAGVICSQQVCNNSDVRLVNGRNKYEGRVEICQRGVWGTVCDDNWDDTDAMVVCRQLGLSTDAIAIRSVFIRTTSGRTRRLPTAFGRGTGPIFLDNVGCRGNETVLDDCSHNGVNVHDCSHVEDAGVICSQQECVHGTVRLVDGISQENGRVEFCNRGVWGTVCDDDWDNNDATVVCRQLGYSTVRATATRTPHFGPGAGFTFLDQVNCNGNETNLVQCRRNRFGAHDCEPAEDSGVFCSARRVERCTVDEITRVNSSLTRTSIQQFGSCEQYEQASDLCNVYYNETDYVYMLNSMRQSQIAATLSRIPTTNISATDECRDNVLRIICHNFFVPCGRNGTIYLPTSICQEECSYVRDTCQTFWNQAFQAIESELGRVNCETPGSALSPLPSCCTGAGVSIPTTTMPTTSSATLSHHSYIIGGAMGGALILVILLLILVVITAVVVMNKKKAAVQSFQLEVLACPATPNRINRQDSTRIESGGACNSLSLKEGSLKDDDSTKVGQTLSVGGASAEPNPYSPYTTAGLLRPNTSNGKPQRVGSSYVRQLSVGMLISQENIRLLECIGQGEFGIVYKAQLAEMGTQPSLKTVAVKTLKGFFDQNEINKIMEESVKMKRFNHPNVMNLIGVCIDAGPAPYIVMPFMANGSLLSYLRKERPNLLLDETADEDLVLEVKKRLTVMCSQIASGMEYLTKESFIHRDLATRNCMIDAHFVIKITDFGLSEDVYARNYFRQGQGSAVKLPVKWMAPESLQDGVFSDKTDVWSFGITCWEIFSGGKTPYPGVDPLSLVQLLENGRRLDKPANSACPEEMYSIMLKCWNSDPNERPCFSALVKSISGFAEKTAGYLDVSNYNPFEVNVPTAKTGGVNGDVQTQEEHDASVGVPLDNPPVEINVQCPSEDEGSRDDSLL